MIAFQRQILVRFHHCDPAALVYYPRYFEMIDGIIEDWFAMGLKTSTSSLLYKRAIVTPTVHFTVDFRRPSVYGDNVTFKLVVTKIGRTSCHLSLVASKGRQLRMTVKQVIVFLHARRRTPVPLPPDIVKRMRRFLVPAAAAKAADGPRAAARRRAPVQETARRPARPRAGASRTR
jgi:4-hydroxybenzoyl-CoA thioesterase